MPFNRREIKGGVKQTTLRSDFTAGALTVPGSDFTGWPLGGANGDFLVAVNLGKSNMEVVRCSSRSGNDLTVIVGGRNQDGTADVLHTSGETLDIVISATDADEANKAVAETIGKVTTAEDILVATGANAFKRLGKGAASTLLKTTSGGTVGYERALAADLDTTLSKGDIRITDPAGGDLYAGRRWFRSDLGDFGLWKWYDGTTVRLSGGQLIDKVTLSVNTATITLSWLAGFSRLQVVYSIRGTTAAASVGLLLAMNGDTVATNYHFQRISAADGAVQNNETVDSRQCGVISAANSQAGARGSGEIICIDPDSASIPKVFRNTFEYTGTDGNSTETGIFTLNRHGSLVAVTSIVLAASADNLASGSWAELWGL